MATAGDDLRSAQVDVTRRRIARAVVELIAADGAAKVSFPAVAERSGVSLRTVYRHFPNKEALLAAALDAGSEAATTAFPFGDRTVPNLPRFLPLLWGELYENRDIIRVQHTTPDGIALRARRLAERRKEVEISVRREVPDLDEQAVTEVAALVTVLMGTPMLIDLVDHLGFEVADAARLSAFAIRAVVEAVRTEGGIP